MMSIASVLIGEDKSFKSRRQDNIMPALDGFHSLFGSAKSGSKVTASCMRNKFFIERG
jgi:hypothetical protein